MLNIRTGRLLALAAAWGCFAMPRAAAQTFTWNGPATGTQSWSQGANWSSNPLAPTGGSAAVIAFGNTANSLVVNLDVAGPFQLNQLSLGFTGGSGFTLAGGTLDFQANGVTQPTILFDSAVITRISSAIRISAATLTLAGGGGSDVVLSGTITGSGGLTLNNGGFTTTYLSAQASYTGTTTLTNGFLLLATTSAIDRRSAVTVNSTLALNPAAGTTPAGVPTGSFDQRLASIAGGAAGRITLGSAVLGTGFDDSSTTFNGIIGSAVGSGAILKAGAGILTLNGASTYFGPTIVDGGGLTFAGSSGSALNSSGYSIAAGAKLTLDNATVATNPAGRLRDTGSVGLRGGMVELLAGPVSENAGALSAAVGSGTLDVPAGNTLSFTTFTPGSGTLFLKGPGTVNFRTTVPATVGSGVGVVPAFYTNGDLVKIASSNAVALAAGDYTTFAAGIASSNILDSSPTLTVASATTFNSMVFPGTGGQAVTLNAPLTLTAGALHVRNNTLQFLGTSSLVSPGTLFLSSANSSGTPTLTFDSPISAANLSISGPGLVVNLNRPATLGTNGVVAVNNGGSLFVSNNGSTTSGGFSNLGILQVLGTLDVTGVAGGYSIPNGTTVQGSGTVNGTLRSGTGSVLNPSRIPGPAKLTVQTLSLEPGGRYDWVLNSVVGATGTQSGEYTQGIVQATTLNVASLSSGNTFTIRPITLKADNTAGAVSDFDATKSYSWQVVNFGGLTGTISSDRFTVDASQFSNSLAGGTLIAGQVGNSLVLQFSPVPEPGCLLLFGFAGLAAVRARRRIN